MDVAVTTRVRSAQQRYVIDDSSKVGEARRAAQTLASFEFSAEIAGKVALAATELANNLLLHAGGGELLIQPLGDEDFRHRAAGHRSWPRHGQHRALPE